MEMWATATYDLGLTTPQFWALTPRKFQALCERFAEADTRANRRTQMLGFYIANFFGAKKENGQRYTPADFGLGDGIGQASSDGMPTLAELKEAERRAEAMLEAKAQGKPNPFPAVAPPAWSMNG